MCIRDSYAPLREAGFEVTLDDSLTDWISHADTLNVNLAAQGDDEATSPWFDPVSYTHLDVYKRQVYRIEEAVLRTLLYFGVTGHRVGDAPGIYVRLDDPFGHAPLAQRPQKKIIAPETTLPPAPPDGEHRSAAANHALKTAGPDFTGLGKIAALGIKVSRNCTYHGVALNLSLIHI